MISFFALVVTSIPFAQSTASVPSTISRPYSGLFAYHLCTLSFFNHLMVSGIFKCGSARMDPRSSKIGYLCDGPKDQIVYNFL